MTKKYLEKGDTFKCGKGLVGTIVCSDAGGAIYTLNRSVVVFKKACTWHEHSYIGVIVKLRIPKGTCIRADFNKRQMSREGRKCRAEKAKVLTITLPYSNRSLRVKTATSEFDNRFRYRIGCIVKPQYAFDMAPWGQCSSGIHFFFDREDAVNY